MPVFLKDDRSVLFVHIPKTGGSTIERTFRKSGWSTDLRESRRTRPDLLPLRRCSPQHYQASLLEEMFDLSRFDLVFLVTRHPVSRFRSEYTMRHTKATDTRSAAVEKWAARVFGAYDRNPYHLDNHIRPQSEFHLPQAEVYRFENGLESVVADLNQRFTLGLSTEMPHALSSIKRGGTHSSLVEISGRLSEQLASFYGEDFSRFGYSR